MIEELIFFLCFVIVVTFDRLTMINSKVKLHERISELESEIAAITVEIEKSKEVIDETADMLSLQEALMKEYTNNEGLTINIPTTIYEEGADDCDDDDKNEYADVWRPVVKCVEAEMKIRLDALKEHAEDIELHKKAETLTEIYNRRATLRSASLVTAASTPVPTDDE